MARGIAGMIVDTIRGNWQRGRATGENGQESDAHEAEGSGGEGGRDLSDGGAVGDGQ